MSPEFDRRQIVIGALASAGLAASPLRAQTAATPLTLRVAPAPLTLGGRNLQGWDFSPSGPIWVSRGDTLAIGLTNDLPVPVACNWHGLDGEAALAPLTAVAPIAVTMRSALTVPFKRAGTLLFDLRLLGDAQARPLPAAVFAVLEDKTRVADRDEVLLFEEWRLKGDEVLAPATPSEGTQALFTVNGRASADIGLRGNERLRLRLVNGCQRSVIALKFADHAVTVIAIDGAPAEPFPARDGELILAPGTRVDVVIDGRTDFAGKRAALLLHDGSSPRPIGNLVYRDEPPLRTLAAVTPLPASGMPDRLDLQRALQANLAFDGARGEWLPPGELTANNAPAFRIKRGRVTVLTLTNRAATPAVFHLHGHRARLLDRLDDGWKPFWLDTVMVAGGQTQRLAFLADTAGSWLVEGMLTQWSAPRLARWFTVEA